MLKIGIINKGSMSLQLFILCDFNGAKLLNYIANIVKNTVQSNKSFIYFSVL